MFLLKPPAEIIYDSTLIFWATNNNMEITQCLCMMEEILKPNHHLQVFNQYFKDNPGGPGACMSSGFFPNIRLTISIPIIPPHTHTCTHTPSLTLCLVKLGGPFEGFRWQWRWSEVIQVELIWRGKPCWLNMACRPLSVSSSWSHMKGNCVSLLWELNNSGSRPLVLE